MNYITQLNAAMYKIADDDRLNTTHVSLYLALFQLWNLNRFKNPISVNRTEVMKISKIGSKGTYHRCIKDLHNWSYLKYEASHNPLKGSKVFLFNFETSSEQLEVQLNVQLQEQVSGPSLNNINTKNINKPYKRMPTPSLDQILEFFENKIEAEKFFNYYTSNGWKIGGKTPMKNWRAAAKNWQLKAAEFEKINKSGQPNSKLHTSNDKDYHEPL